MVKEEQVRELAYSIWEKEGCPEGKDMEHYYRAKLILEEQEAPSSVVNVQIPSATSALLPSQPAVIERQGRKRRSKKV